jgi:hypothetical protein
MMRRASLASEEVAMSSIRPTRVVRSDRRVVA